MFSRLILVSIFLLSAGALAYEVLLMRLFSIIQWHHFAYMVIGLALLGYGISGTVVSIFQQSLQRHFGAFYTASIILFAVTSVGVFLLAQQIPFNAEEILWDRQQMWYLSGLFLLLSVPFFFAATAICLAFMHYQQHTAQIYAADLVGAGLGSVVIIGLLFWLFPQQVLVAIGLLSLLAALAAMVTLSPAGRTIALTMVSIAAVLFLIGSQIIELKTSPYKSLQQLLRINGAEVKEQRSSPLGLLSIVENSRVPFRHAPGLSLNAFYELPEQVALFTDADGMTVISRFPEDEQQLGYLDFMPSALPFHLTRPNSVLVVGGGGGSNVLQSIYHAVKQIDVLEMNPQVIELVDDVYGQFSGNLYSRTGVNTHVKEVRDYLNETDTQFDLIQIALMDAFSSSSSGLHALHESYLYTVESMQLYVQHLTDNGYLALTRWVKMPPRDTLKLMNTLIEAMRLSGVADPARQLILIRGWQTSTLLMKKTPFTSQEIEAAKTFSQQRSFDIAWYPGISEQEANRYNRLESPVFYQAARQLLSTQRDDYVAQYKFDLTPSVDDRPYFHHFFKWQTFKELLQLRNQGGMPLIEWGYLILVATLLIAMMLSVFLILLPLWFFYTDRQPVSAVRRRDVVYYFFAIGLAFLMIEIAFMQKFIQFLHHPIYSIATTLAAFLVFAGLGSQVSNYLVSRFDRKHVLMFAIAVIVLFSLVYLLVLGSLFSALAEVSLAWRMLLTVLLISPLAFAMGMPFPLALSSLARHAQSYIPWAWGINGCASVISASLATLLAINFGFNAVIVVALLIYVTTLVSYPAEKTRGIRSGA